MAREKKVIDASVLVKIFTTEENSNEAIALIQSHIEGKQLLIVPALAFLEVLNALRYKKQDLKILQQANQDLYNLQLHTESINHFLLNQALEISLKYNLSIYDALYAALAANFGVTLITADKALANVQLLSTLKS